jgi:hypothetical protein
MFVFIGTAEEYDAVRPQVERYLEGSVTLGVPAAQERADPHAPTAEEAEDLVGYQGGLSESLRAFFLELARADRPMTSTEIRERTGLKQASFRGMLGSLPRRVRGALGAGSEVLMVRQRWLGGEFEFWLDEAMRDAVLSHYGDAGA